MEVANCNKTCGSELAGPCPEVKYIAHIVPVVEQVFGGSPVNIEIRGWSIKGSLQLGSLGLAESMPRSGTKILKVRPYKYSGRVLIKVVPPTWHFSCPEVRQLTDGRTNSGQISDF